MEPNIAKQHMPSRRFLERKLAKTCWTYIAIATLVRTYSDPRLLREVGDLASKRPNRSGDCYTN
jgi:hypothetical protein